VQALSNPLGGLAGGNSDTSCLSKPSVMQTGRFAASHLPREAGRVPASG